jgi:hypothetical protein
MESYALCLLLYQICSRRSSICMGEGGARDCLILHSSSLPFPRMRRPPPAPSSSHTSPARHRRASPRPTRRRCRRRRPSEIWPLPVFPFSPPLVQARRELLLLLPLLVLLLRRQKEGKKCAERPPIKIRLPVAACRKRKRRRLSDLLSPNLFFDRNFRAKEGKKKLIFEPQLSRLYLLKEYNEGGEGGENTRTDANIEGSSGFFLLSYLSLFATG